MRKKSLSTFPWSNTGNEFYSQRNSFSQENILPILED